MIEIHEFSTDREYQRTSQEGGVVGNFINATLDPIPHIIEKAINNREFAITETSAIYSPALVAREICQNEEEWSVLAVIIGGTDGLSAYYRYFCTWGKGNLHHLVHWWIEETYPIFNPLEPVQVKLYEPQKHPETSLDGFEDILKASAPIILPSNRLSSAMITHTIAQKISGGNNIAWAWNVQGLETPQTFQAIYPHSPQAALSIIQAINPLPPKESIVTEHDIKLAMQNLMNREDVKLEYLQVLETALAEPKIDNNLWLSFFDARGVTVALSEGIYTSEIVRLLTLRAIILPSTLPEFLDWLQRRGNQKKQIDTCLKFQKQIIDKATGKAPLIAARVFTGVKLLILQLLEKPQLLESISWLLGSSKSIWFNLYNYQLSRQIEHDLSLMSKVAQHQDLVKIGEWEPIWQEIKVFWLPDKVKKMPHYLPLAKLFRLLGDYKIAAVFYQISVGSVPKKVFAKLNAGQRNQTMLFKMKVEKYVSPLEPVGLVLRQIAISVFSLLSKIFYIVVPLILILSFIFLIPVILSVFIYVSAILLSVVLNILPILIVVGIISWFADN